MYLFNFIFLFLLAICVHAQVSVHTYTDSIRHYEESNDSVVLRWIREVSTIIESHNKIDSSAIYDFYRNLGTYYFSRRDYEACADAYQQSISYLPKKLTIEQNLAQCKIYNHLGISYTLLNQKKKGTDYFKKSIHCDLKTNGAATLSVLRKYRNLARAEIMSGAYSKAVETCNRVLTMLTELEPSNKKQAFRTNLLAARALLHLSMPDSAIGYLAKAEHLIDSHPDYFTESDQVYLYKAMLRNFHVNQDTPSVKRAFQHYLQANKRRLKHTEDISAHIDYYFLSALYLYRYFDLHRAKLQMDTLMQLQCREDIKNNVIISAIRRPADIITHLEVNIRINFSLWYKSQDIAYLNKAIQAANLGFDVLDYYRRTLNDPASRLEYVEYEYALYDVCFEPYYEAYQQNLITLNDFWTISEKARAINISEQANLRSLEDSYFGLDSILVNKEHLLMDSIFMLSNQLDEHVENHMASTIQGQITDLQLKLYQLQDHLAALHPQYQQKRIKRSIPSISSLQERLMHDQVLVEFILAKSLLDDCDLLFTIIIEKDNATIYNNRFVGLPEIIKKYFQLLSKPPLSYTEKSKMRSDFKRTDSIGAILKTILLHDSLIEEYNHFIIIPHKALFYLPFSALPVQNLNIVDINDWDDYEFLSEHNTIQLAFSAEWWLTTAVQSKVDQGTHKSLFVHAEQSEVGRQDLSDTDPYFVTVGDREKLLDILSRENFELIYFAGHAAFDHKTQNGLIFIEEDNPFTFNDILDLNLENSKVVLAACETQIGEESNAEGLMGFAYNFAWAGAQAVSGSLWKIPDQQSSRLLKSCLETPDNLSLLLSNAQKNYLATQKGINRHPYYWAGIVAFDASVQASRGKLFYYVLISIALIAGLIWVYIKK